MRSPRSFRAESPKLIAAPMDYARPFPRPGTCERQPTPGPFNPIVATEGRSSEGWMALWTTLMALGPMLGTLVVVIVLLSEGTI